MSKVAQATAKWRLMTRLLTLVANSLAGSVARLIRGRLIFCNKESR